MSVAEDRLDVVQTAVVRVAAHGLPGAALEPVEVPEDRWDAVLRRVRHERQLGLLLSAIDAGEIRVPADVAEIEQEVLEALMHDLRVESTGVVVVAELDQRGIATRVLKGAAVAHSAYPDPVLRSFGDVDLLVRPQDFDDAARALQEIGAERSFPELRPGFDRRFGKGAMFVLPSGLEIDLHRTFVAGPLGLAIDTEALFETGTPFQVGGQTLMGLGPEEQLLHACYHAAVGNPTPRLASMRDVAQMCLARPVDLDRVGGLATDWQGQAVLARGVSLTWRRLALADVTPLSRWALTYEPTEHEQRVLNLYLRRQGAFAAQALAALDVIPGLRNKAAYVRALAFPSDGAREARRRTRAAWWRGGLRAIRAVRGSTR